MEDGCARPTMPQQDTSAGPQLRNPGSISGDDEALTTSNSIQDLAPRGCAARRP